MITNKEVRISVNKTLTRKLIYVIAALTILAMLIPAMAVPAGAASPPGLDLTLVDPLTHTTTTVDGTTVGGMDYGYNITGSHVVATPDGFTGNPQGWSKSDYVNGTNSDWVGTPGATAVVTGVWGETLISNTITGNITYYADKKWGQINRTEIASNYPNNSTYVTWNEETKAWWASANITDTVYGDFRTKDGAEVHVLQGAILNWYLVSAYQATCAWDLSCAEAPVLKDRFSKFTKPTHVTMTASDADYQPFFNTGYYGQTVTKVDGKSSVILRAAGEEAVKILVVPEYPGNPQIPVCPEIIGFDFWTTEYEVVPQVRWVGEKIVLEKHFGPSYTGKYVQFALEAQSVGALEPIKDIDRVDHGTVWTQVDANGFASAILVASDPGQSNVVAGLYEPAATGTNYIPLGNQHFFTVYFLKFESVTIGDVVGKREFHNCGLWTPPNPWNAATDTTTQTLNVSQDALVRARVKGWFTNSNPSVRPVRTVDPANSTLDNPASATLTLPAGRWVLPDDWAALAGPNWKQSRIHWDIMNSPDGSVTDPDWVGSGYDSVTKTWGTELGNYYFWKLSVQTSTMAGKANVIGPFSPGLEEMTPTGWVIDKAPTWDPLRPIHTVVPDTYLNWWDAPMPPAKVIYQIQDAGPNPNKNEMGYFKPAMKTDIYYVWVPDPDLNNTKPVKVYTNPYYQQYVPAHQAIPAFANNIGYDWNSFDKSYGPYIFWEFINQNTYKPLVVSSDPSNYPTVVEVYSDNHGEAMVWLNGNWNLYMAGDPNYLNKGANDVPYLAVVGNTTVQATVDYPYARLHHAFQSNKDVKTWLWGGLILGADEHLYANGVRSDGDATRMVIAAGTWEGYPNGKEGNYPNEAAQSKDKVVWVWVTDRDGLQKGVLGAKVVWTVSPRTGTAVKISNRTCETPNNGISQYNDVTKNIFLTNGFLSGTSGQVTDNPNRLNGVSYLRAPTSYEEKLFNKFWGNGYTEGGVTYNATSTINGLNPKNFAVAAIDLEDYTGTNVFGAANVTMEIYSTDFNPLYPPVALADKYVTYYTNVNFAAFDPLDDAIRPGDANYDGVVNMGDVTAVERMILGYSAVSENAVLNSEGTVDMGTVVKIERAILGLK